MSERVSDRSFFSYRYTIQGFVFILIVFASNLEPIIRILSKTNFFGFDVAAMVAVITFLPSPALGFIISQGWYFIYELPIQRINLRWRVYRSWAQRLIDAKIICRKNFVYDSDLFLSKKWITNRHQTYLLRRNDLFQSLCSTAFSLILGMITGYVIIRPHLFGYNHPWIKQGQWFIFHTLILKASILSIVMCYLSAKRVINEHKNMINNILDELGFK